MRDFNILIVDTILFTLLAIFLGFAVDYIFPTYTSDELPLKSFILVMIQVTVGVVITFALMGIYEHYTSRDADSFLGETVFVVIFFLVQTQLLARLDNIYFHLTGRSF